MARRTKEDAEKTRQSLIETALQLFFEKGTTATTLNDIAQAAGVTKGAFYWHFKNKLELIQAMDQQYAHRYQELDRLLMTEEGDPVQNLITGTELFFGQIEASPELRKFLYIGYFMCEYTEEHAPIKAWDKELYQHYLNLIEDLLRRIPQEQWQSDQQSPPEYLAETITDTMNGFLLRSLLMEETNLVQKAVTTIRIVLTGGGVKVMHT